MIHVLLLLVGFCFVCLYNIERQNLFSSFFTIEDQKNRQKKNLYDDRLRLSSLKNASVSLKVHE